MSLVSVPSHTLNRDLNPAVARTSNTPNTAASKTSTLEITLDVWRRRNARPIIALTETDTKRGRLIFTQVTPPRMWMTTF